MSRPFTQIVGLFAASSPPHSVRPLQRSPLAVVLIVSCCLVCAALFLLAVDRLIPRPEARSSEQVEQPPAQIEEPTTTSKRYVPGNPLAADPERGVAAHPKSAEAMYDIGPEPEVSAWDGIMPQAAQWFEQNLYDYGSARVVSASRPIPTPAGWMQVVRLRGKNAFGAFVVNTFVFYVKHGQLVEVGSSSG